MSNNTICGEVEVVGVNFLSNVCGYILAFRTGLVIAKINFKIYALILGEIQPRLVNERRIFIDYLLTKPLIPIFIV